MRRFKKERRTGERSRLVTQFLQQIDDELLHVGGHADLIEQRRSPLCPRPQPLLLLREEAAVGGLGGIRSGPRRHVAWTRAMRHVSNGADVTECMLIVKSPKICMAAWEGNEAGHVQDTPSVRTRV